MSQSEELTADAVLVARCRAGDDAAYNAVISRHWDRIFARAFQLLQNHEDAEEVTQDTFIRARRGLEHFRGDAALSSWLYQIATNLARNRYWYWWRRKRSESLSLQQQVFGEGEMTLEDLIPDAAQSPSEDMLTQELVDRVGACMAQLGDRHREILTLRNVQNLSYEEIAARLGISVGTVKSRIARAREQLRALLGEDFQ